MYLWINGEKVIEENGVSLFYIKEKYKKNSDLIIVNSFQVTEDKVLKDGDKISLIKKGENLRKEEIKNLINSRSSKEVVEALEKATIGIAGLGGLGSNLAIAFARTSVGKLVLVDYDVVEPSNLNRQSYFMRDLGIYKTEAIKKQIKEINPFIEVELVNEYLDEKNTALVFKDCDIVLEAFDKPENKAMIVNEILEKSNSIIISGNGMAGYDSSNLIKSKKINSRFYLAGDLVSEAKEFSGLMATRVLIVVGHMANLAVRILLKENKNGGI
ncbi:MAG: sulfur carrier protein ThiS adenylyltransferase ThiF [Sarcina sp.]